MSSWCLTWLVPIAALAAASPVLAAECSQEKAIYEDRDRTYTFACWSIRP